MTKNQTDLEKKIIKRLKGEEDYPCWCGKDPCRCIPSLPNSEYHMMELEQQDQDEVDEYEAGIRKKVIKREARLQEEKGNPEPDRGNL